MLTTIAACGDQSGEPVPGVAGTAVQRQNPDDALRGVVNAYIREHTTEGMPYYIESKPTEFEAFEDGITRKGGAFVCVARFVSGTDIFHVAFHLKREMNAYVITQVILRSVNSDSLQRTLYSRETLVL